MKNEKLNLLRIHECSSGLDEMALAEIADAAELVRLESGQYAHRANEICASVFLVVQGRLTQSALDHEGRIILQRPLKRGDQFGALAAAHAEPLPVNIVSREPSTLLKFEYDKARALANKFDIFGLNLTRLLAQTTREVIFGNKLRPKPKLVGIFHQSCRTRVITRRILDRLIELQERPCVFSGCKAGDSISDVPHRSLVEDGEELQDADIRRQIAEWSDCNRVFFDIDATFDPVRAAQVVELSERIFWCVATCDWQDSVKRLKAIESRAPGWRDKISIVWLLDNGEQVAPHAPELENLAEHSFKVSLNTNTPNQGRALESGVERLVHQLRGVRIGLALGGGAARGMAHLGVIKSLQQAGIVVDMIAGTSAGAMTGVMGAANFDMDYLIERFAEDLRPPWAFRMLPRGGQWYLLYKYRRGQFDQMLRNYLDDWRLEQLPLPISVVTVDLVTGRPVIRDRGDAVHAIVESINLPVLSAPIRRGGQMLVDGGLVNNVPADILVAEGCNLIIAVSVTAKMEHQFAGNCPDTPTDQMRRASTLQTVLRGWLVQNVSLNSLGVNPADVVIEPDVTSFDLTEFTRTKELSAIGEKAAEGSIPKIKSLLAQIDHTLLGED